MGFNQRVRWKGRGVGEIQKYKNHFVETKCFWGIRLPGLIRDKNKENVNEENHWNFINKHMMRRILCCMVCGRDM